MTAFITLFVIRMLFNSATRNYHTTHGKLLLASVSQKLNMAYRHMIVFRQFTDTSNQYINGEGTK